MMSTIHNSTLTTATALVLLTSVRTVADGAFAPAHTFDDPTPTTQDKFGACVVISGNRIIVGAPLDDTNGMNVGQAHLFDATTWELLRTFDDPSPTFGGEADGDAFGIALAIEGNLLLIGAPGHNTGENEEDWDIGQAHLFDVNTGELLRTFDDPMPTAADVFGASVAIHGDRVLIAAPGDDTNGQNVGQAFLFDATTGDLLQTFDDPTPTVEDSFGGRRFEGVELNADYALIAADGDDTHGTDVGQVHVFDANTGELLRTLDDPTPTLTDQFGTSIDLDGTRAVIGARGDDTGNDVGQAHLFDVATGELLRTFDDPTPTDNDNFGEGVALDGDRAVISGFVDDTHGPNVGQAHLFDTRTGEVLATFDDPTPTGQDGFGVCVDIEGERVVIGAADDNTHGIDIGQAHLFVETTCPADLDGSGVVDVADLLQMLGAWGACGDCIEDLNGDGAVDVADLLAILAAWGACEE
jgi:outer membrane protein assembly factor BamB